MHRYIYPSVIESKMATIQPNYWEKTTIDGCLALVERKEPVPMYERKIKRVVRAHSFGTASRRKDVA